MISGLGLTLILLSLIGAPLLRITAQDTDVRPAACGPELTPLRFKVTHGSYVLLSSPQDEPKTKVPIVLLTDIHRSFDDFAYAELVGVFRKLQQPALVTLVNNLSNGGAIWLIAPPEINASEGRIISGCAKPILPMYGVWQIESVQ